jgi:hypothetical protein
MHEFLFCFVFVRSRFGEHMHAKTRECMSRVCVYICICICIYVYTSV